MDGTLRPRIADQFPDRAGLAEVERNKREPIPNIRQPLGGLTGKDDRRDFVTFLDYLPGYMRPHKPGRTGYQHSHRLNS
jgi:hypothetical protein